MLGGFFVLVYCSWTPDGVVILMVDAVQVTYCPGESDTPIFGGNSNWRVCTTNTSFLSCCLCGLSSSELTTTTMALCHMFFLEGSCVDAHECAAVGVAAPIVPLLR